jgi:hypothetical protein
MSNIEALKAANVIPQNHTLTSDDIDTINDLSPSEVDTIIALKAKLGDEFIQRNVSNGPANCFL